MTPAKPRNARKQTQTKPNQYYHNSNQNTTHYHTKKHDTGMKPDRVHKRELCTYSSGSNLTNLRDIVRADGAEEGCAGEGNQTACSDEATCR